LLPLVCSYRQANHFFHDGAAESDVERELHAEHVSVERVFGFQAPDDRDKAKISRDVFADQVFLMPARFLAGRMVSAGVPAYLYQFSYVPRSLRDRFPDVPPGAEISYVFGTIDRYRTEVEPAPATSEDRAVSDAMQEYWLAFARTGNPNDGTGTQVPRNHRERPAWPEFDPGEGTRLQFDVTVEATHRYRKDALDYQLRWSEAGGTIAGPPK
jgi:carboxylesterase type B